MNESIKNLLRQLPSIEELIHNHQVDQVLASFPKPLITEGARGIIQEYRQDILDGKINEMELEKIIAKLINRVRQLYEGNLRKVINGTGVILHTNLGRALLSKKAQDTVQKVASGYSNLELNLEKGIRGSRYSHVEELLTKLTGAESALVVNNNAGAVLLALNALAKDKEAIVSRGQLVEIGGAFRIPDVMKQSGATLVEVGTTNKTYQKDYKEAITEDTGVILKVHTSNYKVVGFTHETSLAELVELGKDQGIPVMEDLGSGFLVNLQAYGIGAEPTVQDCVKSDADIVTFSGDKLLGGPQAGIIVGKKSYIDKMKSHPLTRALRIDKLTVAALQATLIEYLDFDTAVKTIPILNMLTCDEQIIREKAEILKSLLEKNLSDEVFIKIDTDFSQVGGGALPTTAIPTTVLKFKGPISSNLWAENLRKASPALMLRVKDNQIIIDLRTILEDELDQLVKILVESLNNYGE